MIANITNPKVTLFFPLSCLSSPIPRGAALRRRSLSLARCSACHALVFGCVSLLATVAGRFNSSVKGQLFLNRAAGCVSPGWRSCCLSLPVDRSPILPPYPDGLP
ncbi:MAG: hypothetical protein ACLSAH_02015 [Bilophila wadsworthia]